MDLHIKRRVGEGLLFTAATQSSQIQHHWNGTAPQPHQLGCARWWEFSTSMAGQWLSIFQSTKAARPFIYVVQLQPGYMGNTYTFMAKVLTVTNFAALVFRGSDSHCFLYYRVIWCILINCKELHWHKKHFSLYFGPGTKWPTNIISVIISSAQGKVWTRWNHSIILIGLYE